MRPVFAMRFVLACGVALFALGCSNGDETYYAIERAGVVLGYVAISVAPGDSTTGEPTVEHTKLMNRLTLLGKGVDVIIESERGVDPRTGKTLFIDMEAHTGEVVAGATCAFDGDTARYTPKPGGEPRSFILDPDVPGQRFSGTVENNLIDGVFEINHERYDGSNAPPFPPAVSESLERYIKPELAIESNDPAIREKALELTDGATDSWDAACRLSFFVATEIRDDIPGGGSALGTLRTGKAECGGHSRLLAALCRAVGIPVRTVMGCMYTGIKGGTFGQHMWDEVHMGEAGWIPVDATAHEVDYIDAGHIRLGTLTSFNPIEMEVLDYEVAPTVPDPVEEL